MLARLSGLNPLRYFLVMIRRAHLKGVGMEILWPRRASIGGLGVALLTISILHFHKALDGRKAGFRAVPEAG